MAFKLHPRLNADLIHLGDLKLSRVMLLPDPENPWIVLIPRREDIRELYELSDEDQKTLLSEINLFSKIMVKEFNPDKLNIGALGNMVPQLHIHIICRYEGDRAWPGSIWGISTPYNPSKVEHYQNVLTRAVSFV